MKVSNGSQYGFVHQGCLDTPFAGFFFHESPGTLFKADIYSVNVLLLKIFLLKSLKSKISKLFARCLRFFYEAIDVRALFFQGIIPEFGRFDLLPSSSPKKLI
jgi:hypothetical protein